MTVSSDVGERGRWQPVGYKNVAIRLLWRDVKSTSVSEPVHVLRRLLRCVGQHWSLCALGVKDITNLPALPGSEACVEPLPDEIIPLAASTELANGPLHLQRRSSARYRHGK